jgi:hypothetical protein
MNALNNIDLAFVRMNLPYTMRPEEAAEVVRSFHPKVVYPYHHRGSDVKVFEKTLAEGGSRRGCGTGIRASSAYRRLRLPGRIIGGLVLQK